MAVRALLVLVLLATSTSSSTSSTSSSTRLVVEEGGREGEVEGGRTSLYSPQDWEGLVLACRGEGEVSWTYQGEELGSREGLEVEGGRVVFQAPLYGSYQCRQAREGGGVGYAEVTFTEFEEEEVMGLVEGPVDMTVEEGEEVVVSCRAQLLEEGEEGEVVYSWLWNSSPLAGDWLVESSEEGSRVSLGELGGGGRLCCIASLGGERLYQEGELALAPLPLPSISSHWGEPILLLQGSTLSLHCKVRLGSYL